MLGEILSLVAPGKPTYAFPTRSLTSSMKTSSPHHYSVLCTAPQRRRRRALTTQRPAFSPDMQTAILSGTAAIAAAAAVFNAVKARSNHPSSDLHA